MIHLTIFEIDPDVDMKTGPSLTNITGNFRATSSGSDLWTWASGWPSGTWYMYGATTSPVSGTTTTTNAQKFNGSATSIAPTGSGTSYQIWYKGVRIGHVFVSATAGTSQWWMYQTSYTTSGPYYPTPTDSDPLKFVLGTAVTGTGWKGEDY